MGRYTLFAYVDGADLDAVASDLDTRFAQFVSENAWHETPSVVNQRHVGDPSQTPGAVPGWDLGLNIPLPDVGQEPQGWFRDIEKTVAFLAELHGITGREFILGVHDAIQGVSEDLFSVDGPTPNLQELRQVLGVREGAR